METKEYSLLLKKEKKRKSPAMKCFQWDFIKETKVTFAMGKLSFNALMHTDEDRLIISLENKIGF